MEHTINPEVFPGGSESTCQCRRGVFNPELENALKEEMATHSSFLACRNTNPHGQRSLASCSPWGCKESDMAEQLSTAQHMSLMYQIFASVLKYFISLKKRLSKQTNTQMEQNQVPGNEPIHYSQDQLVLDKGAENTQWRTGNSFNK